MLAYLVLVWQHCHRKALPSDNCNGGRSSRDHANAVCLEQQASKMRRCNAGLHAGVTVQKSWIEDILAKGQLAQPDKALCTASG